MTRSVRGAHTLSRPRQGGSVRSSVEPRLEPSAATVGEIPLARGVSDVSGLRRRAGMAAVLLGSDVSAMVGLGMFTHMDATLHLVACAVIVSLYTYFGLYRPRLTLSILDDLPLLAICLVAGPAVGAGELSKIEIGQHIPIDHQKCLVEFFAKQTKSTNGAERFLLLGVGDPQIPLAPIAAKRSN